MFFGFLLHNHSFVCYSRLFNYSLQSFYHCCFYPQPKHIEISLHVTKPTKWSAWTSAQSDQNLLSALNRKVKDPSFLHADSEDSDQTGRTGHFVGFVMLRLINVKLPSLSMFLSTDKHRNMRMVHNIITDRSHDSTSNRALAPSPNHNKDCALILRYLTYNFSGFPSVWTEFSFQLKRKKQNFKMWHWGIQKGVAIPDYMLWL